MKGMQGGESATPAKKKPLEAAESLAPGPVSLTAGPSQPPPGAVMQAQLQPTATATEKVTRAGNHNL